jgi:hydroxymethylglutaryl-CoA lyase
MLDWRLKAFRHWQTMDEPTHWPKLQYPAINYQDIIYYSAPKGGGKYKSMDDVPKEILDTYDKLKGVAYSVLIPNEKGLDNALKQRERFDEVNLFLSASETHNRKNVNRSIGESLSGLERVVERALSEGLRCEGVISVSFGCPYEGKVPPERVFMIAERLRDAGCEEIAFGDTTGMANPRQVGEFFAEARERLRGAELTAHFHNTRGQGLANVLAALEQGIDSFESAFGELGGCPVPPGTTGNISSEDLVSMLGEMGVETGIDLDRLIAASREVQEVLGRPLGAHVLKAGPVDWHEEITPDAQLEE